MPPVDRSSGFFGTRDELLMSLLSSEAVVDSRGYEVLSAEEVEELKKVGLLSWFEKMWSIALGLSRWPYIKLHPPTTPIHTMLYFAAEYPATPPLLVLHPHIPLFIFTLRNTKSSPPASPPAPKSSPSRPKSETQQPTSQR